MYTNGKGILHHPVHTTSAQLFATIYLNFAAKYNYSYTFLARCDFVSVSNQQKLNSY